MVLGRETWPRLADEGVGFHLDAPVEKVEKIGQDACGIQLTSQGSVSGDALLLAVGRRARLSGLELERAGVEHGPKGRVGLGALDHLHRSGGCSRRTDRAASQGQVRSTDRSHQMADGAGGPSVNLRRLGGLRQARAPAQRQVAGGHCLEQPG